MLVSPSIILNLSNFSLPSALMSVIYSFVEQFCCCHYGTYLELWHRCCPWWQLYMVHRSQFRLPEWRKIHIRKFISTSCVYPRVGRFEGAYTYTRTFMQGKARTCWKTYLWSRPVSPWYLNLWFWTMVSRHKCWSQSIGPMVLSYYGFGPWYWERPKALKEEGDHLAKHLGINWISNMC